MVQPSPPLRVLWAPHGAASGAVRWWPDHTPTTPQDTETVRFGDGVAVSYRDGVVDAAWADQSWQPVIGAPRVTVTVTARELRLTVPPLWRAQLHFGWRDGYLFVSSDLRTAAASVASSRPALAGAAAFLANGWAGPGVGPSLYRDVWTLRPGHSVAIRADGSTRERRTWRPERDDGFAGHPLETVVTRLREHLDALAERILDRHQRVACLFSGGLDSSLVAATLLRRAPRRVLLANVGSGLGTAAEGLLRDRLLREYGTVSHQVDLPARAGLIRSLRATNAVAALPVGSPFSHVFEEIIKVAQDHGCDAIATGDGGDEVFAERDEVLVDLLARHRRALPAVVGHFARRNGEPGLRPLLHAMSTLHALDGRGEPPHSVAPGDVLFGHGLAAQVVAARRGAGTMARELWTAGWSYSGMGSYRRAAAVPEWEPVSAAAPGFPVLSPLIDELVLGDALALRRDALVPRTRGGQPKWLLRQAALTWLPPEVALHPKVGSADGQILARLREAEHRDVLELLGSGTAAMVGLCLPAAVEDPEHPLWYGDGWIRAAALVAWLDQPLPARPVTLSAASVPVDPSPPARATSRPGGPT